MNFSQIERLGNVLNHYVMPLYTSSPKWIGVVGTCFFVRCQGRSFLVTAAHVLETVHATESLYYYVAPGITRRVVGRALLTPSPSGRQLDREDIGVVELIGEALPPYPEVKKLCVDLHELRPRQLPRADASYLLLGFPSTKNELHRVRKEFVAKAYAFHGSSAMGSLYEALDLPEQNHLLINFDPVMGKGADNKEVRFPKPQGMSGCPVFRIGDGHNTGAFPGFPVVAIAVEHRAMHKVIQCTDIAVAIRMIGVLLARSG